MIEAVSCGGAVLVSELFRSDDKRKAVLFIPELISVCDSINIWDNSTDKPYRIFQKKPESIDYFDNPVWSKNAVIELTGISL